MRGGGEYGIALSLPYSTSRIFAKQKILACLLLFLTSLRNGVSDFFKN